jgi:hypothetical protein
MRNNTSKVRIQKYTHTVIVMVIDMLPRFDFILGTVWSRKQQVTADFGDESVNPRLCLRHPHVPLYPIQFPVQTYISCENGLLLSPIQAKQALARASTQGMVPFLVMVRERSEAAALKYEDVRKQKLQSILDSYESVFEVPRDWANLPSVPECIPISPNNKPINRPAFRLALKERQEVETQVVEMLKKGCIEPSGSTYGAPVLFVPKPDGSMRMCIDYRALHKITTKNKYPLPRIDDLMDNLSGAQYFTSLDLTSGYHQLILNLSDHPKTAFNMHIGNYEWKVLPMGLANAPAMFQSATHQVFGRHLNKFVCVYLDASPIV